jgi:hypothetical protein
MFKFAIGLVLKRFGIGSKVSHRVSSNNALDYSNSAIVLENYLVGTVNGLALGASIEIWLGTNKISVSKEQFYLWVDN